MKTSHKRILLLIILLGVIGVIGATGVQLNSKQNRAEISRIQLKADLENVIGQHRTGEIPEIDFSTLTDFSWDRLYFFGPYTPPHVIDSVLGTYWIGSRFTQIESSEGYTLLVFTCNGKVVQHLEFPRFQADFSYLEYRSGYASEANYYALDEAKFIVDESGRVIW